MRSQQGLGEGTGEKSMWKKNVLITILITAVLLAGTILPLTAVLSHQPAYASAVQAQGEVQGQGYEVNITETNLPRGSTWTSVIYFNGSGNTAIAHITSNNRSHDFYGIVNGSYVYNSYANDSFATYHIFSLSAEFVVHGSSVLINVTMHMSAADIFHAAGLSPYANVFIALLQNYSGSAIASGIFNESGTMCYYAGESPWYEIVAPGGYVIKTMSINNTTYTWPQAQSYPAVVVINGSMITINATNYTFALYTGPTSVINISLNFAKIPTVNSTANNTTGTTGNSTTGSNNTTNTTTNNTTNSTTNSTNQSYNVTFQEMNLPRGMKWSVVMGFNYVNLTELKNLSWANSSGRYIEFHGVKNGLHSYNSYAMGGIFDWAGNFTVNGRSLLINVTLPMNSVDIFYSFGFREISAHGIIWNINANGSLSGGYQLVENGSIGLYQYGTTGNYQIKAPAGYMVKSLDINNTTYVWSNASLYPVEVSVNSVVKNINSTNYTFISANTRNTIVNVTIVFAPVSVVHHHVYSPFPYWILLFLIGIGAIILGVWDGNRRRKIKRGHEENERRKGKGTKLFDDLSNNNSRQEGDEEWKKQ